MVNDEWTAVEYERGTPWAPSRPSRAPRRTCGTAVPVVCYATTVAGVVATMTTGEGYWLAASRVYVVTSDS